MIVALCASFPSFRLYLLSHYSIVMALLFKVSHFPFAFLVSEQLQLSLDNHYGAPDGYHHNSGI
jgi:hypothetical protein